LVISGLSNCVKIFELKPASETTIIHSKHKAVCDKPRGRCRRFVGSRRPSLATHECAREPPSGRLQDRPVTQSPPTSYSKR
jgi:hypothetical protein